MIQCLIKDAVHLLLSLSSTNVIWVNSVVETISIIYGIASTTSKENVRDMWVLMDTHSNTIFIHMYKIDGKMHYGSVHSRAALQIHASIYLGRTKKHKSPLPHGAPLNTD